MSRPRAAILVAGALAAAACGGSGDGGEVAASTSLETTTTTTSAAGGDAPPETGTDPAVEVPEELDFVAPDVRGGQVVGADFAGQAVVVWFWAPW